MTTLHLHRLQNHVAFQPCGDTQDSWGVIVKRQPPCLQDPCLKAQAAQQSAASGWDQRSPHTGALQTRLRFRKDPPPQEQ